MAESLLFALLIALIVLLCLFGLGLSAVSISGTWLVAAAAAVGRLLPGAPRYGWGFVLGLVAAAALVEGVEALAGAWGVRRRGGSRLAGVAAIAGGLAGLLLGTLIPIPILGNLIGMLAGSFGLVYVVERHRAMAGAAHATHVAWGAVLGRLTVMLLKVLVTLGMIGALAAGLGR